LLYFEVMEVSPYTLGKSIQIILIAINSRVFFIFFKIGAIDRGYRHWRFAGVFAVLKRQSECGNKTAGILVSQPMNICVR